MKAYSLPLLLLLTLLIASCEKEEDAPATSQGMLQIEDTRYELTRGAMVYIKEATNYNDLTLKHIIELIFYSEGITVKQKDQEVVFQGQGQRLVLVLGTTTKNELDQGIFKLFSPNLIHVGYFADWREELEARNANPYSPLGAAELTISKQNNEYQIVLIGGDLEGNTITTYFQGPLPYLTLD